MSYMLNENVYSHLTSKGDFYLIDRQGEIYKNYSDIIIFKPSKKMSEKLKENSNLALEPLSEDNNYSVKVENVWKLTSIKP